MSGYEQSDFTAVTRKSLIALAAFAGLFSLWLSLVPIESAVVTPGYVRAENANKPVQHIAGGKVQAVLVSQCDLVEVGTPLITLDDKEERAQLTASLKRYLGLRIKLDRANAVLAGLEGLTFSDATLVMAKRLEEMELLKQATLAHRDHVTAETKRKNLSEARLQQMTSSIEGIESTLSAYREQEGIMAQQLTSLEALSADRLVADIKLQELKQQLIQLRGSIAANESLVREREETVRQVNLEWELSQTSTRQRAQDIRDGVIAELPSVESAMERLRTRIEGKTIRSDVVGRIVQLKHRTAGGTIAAGEVVAVIHPTAQSLVIEARLDPKDIDQVFPGQEARLRLASYHPRETPLVGGIVERVAADRQQDEQGYYIEVQIQVPAENLQQELGSAGKMQLLAGMPVETFLVIGHRSVAEYLWAPIGRGIDRGMRES